jgi:hypothetical protein
MWETPAFCEIKMDAEIGSYQEDGGDRGRLPITPGPENDRDVADANRSG